MVQEEQFLDADYSEGKGIKQSFVHCHRFYELHVMLEGSCAYRAGDSQFLLSAGQYCIFAPGVYHAQQDESLPFKSYILLLNSENFADDVGKQLYNKTEGATVYIGDATEIVPVCKMRMQKPENGDFYTQQIRRLLLELLLAFLLSSMVKETEDVKKTQHAYYQRELLIDDFFHNYFHLSAGEPYLAQRLGVSCRQLDRILKKSYGKSFREMQTESRMEIACDLLVSSNKTVQEISECMGYSTPSNFVVAFKRFVGMTPTEYRKLYKK